MGCLESSASTDCAGDTILISNDPTINEPDPRARTRELAAEFESRGDLLGWFDALYQESEGDTELIPWADLEPNRFLVKWADQSRLSGDGRTALVVGCGLGDDARYLHDRGFRVTAFDISRKAIEWARRLHVDTTIVFEVADLFQPFRRWLHGFDLVVEVYTIQPLPLGIRPQVIDSIARFVGKDGELLVITRGREDDEETVELPWALSRSDLSRFETNGLKQVSFESMLGEEEEPIERFVVVYESC